MKKILYFFFALALGLQMQSCSSDDKTPEPASNPLETKYISIKNAVYNDGSMPEQTTDEKLNGVTMSGKVMNGAMKLRHRGHRTECGQILHQYQERKRLL